MKTPTFNEGLLSSVRMMAKTFDAHTHATKRPMLDTLKAHLRRVEFESDYDVHGSDDDTAFCILFFGPLGSSGVREHFRGVMRTWRTEGFQALAVAGVPHEYRVSLESIFRLDGLSGVRSAVSHMLGDGQMVARDTQIIEMQK